MRQGKNAFTHPVPENITLPAIKSLNIWLSLASTIRLQLAMISDIAHYSMLVLYGLISYGIICSPAMPIILLLWTNTLLYIFMMSLLLAVWSSIICHMKTGVYLKWTLWEKIGSPLLTFEIESTRHWTSWKEKWNEEDQTESDKPQVNHIQTWNNTPGWDLEPEDADVDWNAEEWDALQQNPTWLETVMAVPDFIITALANLDHFRDEAPGWLTLYMPAISITSEPEKTAPQITEIPLENESELENPFPDNEPIPSFQFDWLPNNDGHTESDS